jgi:hypothetical protein
MQWHWRLVYKGGRYSCHREDKEQEEAAEEARNHPAGDEERAEVAAWALAVIVCARIVERRHPMRGVRRVLRSNALNAALP